VVRVLPTWPVAPSCASLADPTAWRASACLRRRGFCQGSAIRGRRWDAFRTVAAAWEDKRSAALSRRTASREPGAPR
jgi:hypothetical protein